MFPGKFTKTTKNTRLFGGKNEYENYPFRARSNVSRTLKSNRPYPSRFIDKTAFGPSQTDPSILGVK